MPRFFKDIRFFLADSRQFQYERNQLLEPLVMGSARNGAALSYAPCERAERI